MARAAYSLQKYAYSTVKSSNGTTYTMNLWDSDSSGSNEWILGPSGIQISYESEDADDKNSPILTSTCTVPIMVENVTQENYLNGIRTSRQERDIWITIRKGTTGGFIWSGYVLIDLEVREDISYPYETTLRAIDGIASLKETPFLRETNSDTSAVPSFPYVREDTWDNAGFQKIIGDSSSWIVRLLDNVGQLLATDDQTGGGLLENYTIQTAFNWWNEDMDVSPSVTEDPLAQMKLSMRPFYKEREDGYMDVPNCYDVLKAFCKNFNIRLIYWQNTFHFIGLDEYNSNENTTYTGASFVPSNIPTREYYYTGGTSSDQNYLGTTNFSLYKMIFENDTAPAEGLQKLAGSQYQGIPPIKKVIGEYAESAGSNIYNGFPLFITHNSVAGLTTTWPSSVSSTHYEFIQHSQANGVYKIMEVTDAADLDGFICQIICDFTNTASGWLKMQSCFSMVAKPSSESSWTHADNKVLKVVSGDLAWYANETGIPAGIGGVAVMLDNYGQYLRPSMNVQPTNNPFSLTKIIFNSNTHPYTNATNNLIPTHADFVGQWDFRFFTYTSFKGNAAAPMGYISKPTQGRVIYHDASNGSTNYDGSPTLNNQTPTDYALDYIDSTDQNLSQPYLGTFIPVNSNVSYGVNIVSLEVKQTGNDSYTYDIGTSIWGDGSGANTKSTIQVYDGADWVYVNRLGKWAKGVYTWGGSSFSYASPTYNKKILNLLAEQILYNQSKTMLTLSTNTALAEKNNTYPSSTRLKFMNPIARLEDVDGLKYIMKRGIFSLNTDQWEADLIQMSYSVPTTATGTQDTKSTGGSSLFESSK